jgi:hypothetical protein
LNQEELFDLPEPVFEDGIMCKNCGTVQPVEQFQQMASGEIKRKCRSCARNQSKLIKALREIYPYPGDGYCCPICYRPLEEIAQHGQTRLQNWVLDHCHDTETFRGWLCHHCNVGLGAFNDNLQRVKNAVKYLESHERTCT